MRKHKGFIPTTFSGRYLWCQNFRDKLDVKAETYDLGADRLTRLNTSTIQLGKLNEALDSVNAFTRSLTQCRKQFWRDSQSQPITVPPSPSLAFADPQLLSDFDTYLRDLVQTIKSHPNYTETDGKDFGFYGPQVDLDLTTIRPVPRLTLHSGHVHIRYDKHYIFSGVRVWVDRATGKMEHLGDITRAAFIDLHPLPETPRRWVYQFHYLLNDQLAGMRSDTYEIVAFSGAIEDDEDE